MLPSPSARNRAIPCCRLIVDAGYVSQFRCLLLTTEVIHLVTNRDSRTADNVIVDNHP
jgi:hypothetical protein